MIEKPVLPHDIMSISVIEELINWLQTRGNKDIDNYKVISLNELNEIVPPSDAWFFQLLYKNSKDTYNVLSINLKYGIKPNSFFQEESHLALRALKAAYKVEKGDIASTAIIQNYFN